MQKNNFGKRFLVIYHVNKNGYEFQGGVIDCDDMQEAVNAAIGKASLRSDICALAICKRAKILEKWDKGAAALVKYNIVNRFVWSCGCLRPVADGGGIEIQRVNDGTMGDYCVIDAFGQAGNSLKKLTPNATGDYWE